MRPRRVQFWCWARAWSRNLRGCSTPSPSTRFCLGISCCFSAPNCNTRQIAMSPPPSNSSLSYTPPADCSPRKARVLRAAFEHLIPGRGQGFHDLGVDFVMGKREGYRFWDIDGQEYLDFHLNGGVFTLGHRNPELLSVLRASLE